MVITFICDFNPFYTSSAIANRYEGLLKGLINKGVTIHLFVTRGYNSWDEYCKKGYAFKSQHLTIKYLITTFNSSLFLRRLNYYVFNSIISKKCDLKLKNIYAEECDYIWLAGGKNLRLSFIKHKKKISAKVFMEFNEYQQLYMYDKSLSVSKKQQLESDFQITLETIKSVDCIAIMTNTLMEHYKTMAKPEAKFLLLPMTVDLSRFQDKRNTEKYKKPYIAFTGTYTNAKDGVNILIHAFARIVKDFPNYHLYLAGFYHYDVPMQQKLIADYQLEDKITYLGVLNKEQIPPFIQYADLLVLSRPDSRQAQGGFPTKLGEYLATGNPVCVTKVGEIPDYLEDNVSAFMAEPGSVDSFADAMHRAFSDKENAMKVGIKGREIAELHFSIDVQVERLLTFLEYNLHKS